jgi:ribose transport system substrate-binding protein
MARPVTLAVFTKNRVNPAYAAARLAADRVAAEAGARTMHYVPETPDDVGQQKVLVGEALASRPDAVVFVPTDDAAMVEDVRRFEAAGIPVVNCVNRMEGRFVAFVGSDDVAVGYTAARALIDGLGGKGDMVVIEGSPGAPTARDRGLAPGPRWAAGDPRAGLGHRRLPGTAGAA